MKTPSLDPAAIVSNYSAARPTDFMVPRCLISALVLAACAAVPAADDPTWFTAGPLIHHFPLTLDPGEGTEAAGPLWRNEKSDDYSLWAVRPFVSELTSEEGSSRQLLVLPPIFTHYRYGEDTRWQLGQLLSGSHLEGIDGRVTRRVSLFPILFWQKSTDPARDYWAFFPLYGTLRNRLFRDEVRFVAFPLYLRSRKADVVTQNYLFPLIHFREGNQLEGWQFFPLIGHEKKLPTIRTNLADEVEVVPGHDKTFALWPVYFRNRLGLGTEKAERVDAVLPLYFGSRSPQRDHTSVLWPFFSWTEDREKEYPPMEPAFPPDRLCARRRQDAGSGHPIFQRGSYPEFSSEVYLWPLYRHRHLQAPPLDRERRQFALFLYSDLRERNTETGQQARRIDSWPFFTWSRQPDGKERLQVLALIEPLRRGRGIERNWSPLWSVWRGERNPQTGASSQSLLWNLYRRDANPQSTNGSLLFGLVQYQKTTERKRWRLLFLGPRLERRTATAGP